MKPTREETESEWLETTLSSNASEIDWIRLVHTTILYARKGAKFKVTIEYVGQDTGIIADIRKKKP